MPARRRTFLRGRLLSWDETTDRAVFICPAGHLQRQSHLMKRDPRGSMPALEIRRRMAWYWADGVSYPCRRCPK